MNLKIKLNLNRRKGPGTQFEKFGIIRPQDGFIDAERVPGQSINGVVDWYRDANGFYYWGGGLENVLETIPITDPNHDWMTKLRLPDIWKFTTGKGIGVAVLDTGIQQGNTDLIYDTENSFQITDSLEVKIGKDADLTDNVGHGSHCAGLVGARNSKGLYIGVAPECTLVVGKFANQSNFPESKFKILAKAIKTAAALPSIQVISISWGVNLLEDDSDEASVIRSLQEAVDFACLDMKKIIVCSMGNVNSIPYNSKNYPGNCVGSIGIGIDPFVQTAPISFSYVNENLITSTFGSNINSYHKSDTALLKGASQSTAIVAGIMALIFQKHGQPVDAKELLASLSTPKNFINTKGTTPLNILDGDKIYTFLTK